MKPLFIFFILFINFSIFATTKIPSTALVKENSCVWVILKTNKIIQVNLLQIRANDIRVKKCDSPLSEVEVFALKDVNCIVFDPNYVNQQKNTILESQNTKNNSIIVEKNKNLIYGNITKYRLDTIYYNKFETNSNQFSLQKKGIDQVAYIQFLNPQGKLNEFKAFKKENLFYLFQKPKNPSNTNTNYHSSLDSLYSPDPLTKADSIKLSKAIEDKQYELRNAEIEPKKISKKYKSLLTWNYIHFITGVITLPLLMLLLIFPAGALTLLIIKTILKIVSIFAFLHLMKSKEEHASIEEYSQLNKLKKMYNKIIIGESFGIGLLYCLALILLTLYLFLIG